MSLSFAPLSSDLSNNNVSQYSLYGSDGSDYQCRSSNQSDLLSLYNDELEKRKMDLNYININKSKKKDELTETDLNFLTNVISIKNKIMLMKNEYKSLLEKSNNIQKDIESLEEMEKAYNNFSKMYLYILNKNGDKNIMDDIIINMECKKHEREILDNKINKNLFEITKLKNIIRVDNLDDETELPIIDTETNPALLCFTCHEGQITHCFNPCGHSFCENCVSRVNIGYVNAICFMCRAKVIGKIKLYFS